MKKFIIAMVALMGTFFTTAEAMSYEQAREQALFLTDKMAYELNLSESQYEAAYEINLDYLMGVNTYDDVYADIWVHRNADLRYILYDWQYDAFCAASYFYRPLWWEGGFWHFGIYARYPHRDYFYFGRPDFFMTYRGGHGWGFNGGRSWYGGHFDRGNMGRGNFSGMRDGWNRGDFRGGRSGVAGGSRGNVGAGAPRSNRGLSGQRGNSGFSGQRGVNSGNVNGQRGTFSGQRGNTGTFGSRGAETQRGNSGSYSGSRGNSGTFGSRSNSSSFGGQRESSTRSTVSRQGGSFGGSSGSFNRGSSSSPSRSFTPSRGSSTGSSMGGSHSGGNSGGGSHGGGFGGRR